MPLLATSTSHVDHLTTVHQNLFDAQWQTALFTATCHQLVHDRNLEMREEMRPWTKTVEDLYHLGSQMTEVLAVVHDGQATLRAIRQDIRDEESLAHHATGGTKSEMQGLLRDQDARHHLLEVVEELLQVCGSLSNQVQDLDKLVNTVLC